MFATALGVFTLLIAASILPVTWKVTKAMRLPNSMLLAAAAASVAALHLALSFLMPGSHFGHRILLGSTLVHLGAAGFLFIDAVTAPSARSRRLS